MKRNFLPHHWTWVLTWYTFYYRKFNYIKNNVKNSRDTDDDIPDGQNQDDSFVAGSKGNEPIPVQSDRAQVEDPINPEQADSNKQLGT